MIVPDGVLFGSSNAHVALRKLLVDDNQLEAVISLPSGVFKPYAGVSTGILVFTKGGRTNDVFFYDVQADGFSLDDKREPVEANDLPLAASAWTDIRRGKGNFARPHGQGIHCRRRGTPVQRLRSLDRPLQRDTL